MPKENKPKTNGVVVAAVARIRKLENIATDHVELAVIVNRRGDCPSMRDGEGGEGKRRDNVADRDRDCGDRRDIDGHGRDPRDAHGSRRKDGYRAESFAPWW